MPWPPLHSTDIKWKDPFTPISKAFGDVYFLPGKGLAEKDYVFLDGVNLKNLLKSTTAVHLGEIGFGAGVNFLLSWDLAEKENARLVYLSIEGFPLRKNDLQKILAGATGANTRLKEKAKKLVSLWPDLVPGFHCLNLSKNVTLILVFGEISEVFPEVEGRFDAWFLDGFSPEKNPAMWDRKILKALAEKSRKGARVATYSAAGKVRRGLEGVGFKIQKRKGFDKKRECLTGTFGKQFPPFKPSGPKTAAIIGGGIAGCSRAYALNKRGYRVTLFEKGKSLAPETSGHPLAVVKPKLQKGFNPYSAFMMEAYLYSNALYDTLPGVWHENRGGLEFLEKAQADDLLGAFPGLSSHLEKTKEGLRFPRAGCVNPKALCQALTKEVQVRLGQTAPEDFEADLVVYANGPKAFDNFGENPFRLTRGQLNYLPALKKTPINEPLSFEGGYLTPKTATGFHILGTSFRVWETPDDPGWQPLNPEDQKTNLLALEGALGSLPLEWKNPPLQGRTALRCETIDHLPVAGSAFNEKKFAKIFKDKQRLHHSQRRMGSEADLKGVYVLSGFASRGFSTAPYAAEILAAKISEEPLPCSRSVWRALSPSRFLLKKLKQE